MNKGGDQSGSLHSLIKILLFVIQSVNYRATIKKTICTISCGTTQFHNYDMSCITFNPFPHIDAFWCLCSKQLLKTWRQKKKLLKTSNFSFCHHVFNSVQLLYFHLKWVSNFVQVCRQSRLLQICRMWERVKPTFETLRQEKIKISLWMCSLIRISVRILVLQSIL